MSQPKAPKSLKQLAETNPTQLGDPVSLKAETSDHEPTEHDRPNKKDADAAATGGGEEDGDGHGEKSLKAMAENKMKANPSMLGDPVSLKAETSSHEPTEDDRGALKGEMKKGSGKSKL